MTVIAATGLLAGAVVSLVNASNGHGLETNESLHEFVLAQLGGDSPQDLTGDPGTGGGGTGTPEEEKQYYKKAHRLEYIHETDTYITDAAGRVCIDGEWYTGDPNTTVIREIDGYGCKYTPNAWAYCDTRQEGITITVTFGNATAEPPTPPAP